MLCDNQAWSHSQTQSKQPIREESILPDTDQRVFPPGYGGVNRSGDRWRAADVLPSLRVPRPDEGWPVSVRNLLKVE